MIKVYNSTERLFNHNGIKILKPKKCYVYKEDNGDYYAELEDNIENIDYYQAGMIITIPTPFPEGTQAFRLTNPEKKSSKIIVKAKHIYFDRANYIIDDKYIVDRNCNYALDYLNNNSDTESPFKTSSNIETLNSYRCVRKSLQEADNTIIEKWGGHLVRDNFNVAINSTIGQDRGVVLKYAKNIKDMTISENWDDVVTKLLPVGKDGILLPELFLTIDEELYDIPYTKVIHFNQDHIEQEDGESNESYKNRLVNDLREQGSNHLELNKYPKVNYSLSTVNEVFNNVSDVGDTLYVEHPKLRVALTTNIISIKYDVILKKYKNIEFGNFKNSLKNLFKDINSTIENVAVNVSEETKTILENELRTATIAIWNTLGASYVLNEGDKILVVDRLPKEKARDVMVINNGGIGFGHDGINGIFNSAWTIDGTLDMQQINVINLVADMIKGGTLKVGGPDNSNGCIEVYDKYGNLTNKIDKDGVQLSVNGEPTTIDKIVNTTGAQTSSAVLLEDAAETDLVSITINPNSQNGAGTLNTETNKYEITVNVCGQNIFDNDMELGFINSSTGENIESSTACRTRGYINVSKARILSIQSKNGRGYIKNLRLYDKDKNYLGYYTLAGSTSLFNLDRIRIDGENEDIYYMRFIITDKDALDDVIAVMYNTTEYSEYVSNSKTYEFDNPIINQLIDLDLPKTYKDISYITTDDETQPDITIEYVKDSILTDYVENRYLNSKAEISMTKNSILLQVSEIYATQDTTKELSTRIGQTAKSIELTATDNKTSCGIVIKLKNEDGTEIDSQSANITLSGLVKFTDLSTKGSTTINGANITTGTISADRIAANSITSGKLNISSLSSVSSNLGTITSGLISNSRAKLDLNDGILNIFNSSGGSMILSNAVRLSATAGVGITSNSNGNISAPSANIDLKACAGATVYIGSLKNADGTTEASSIRVTNGVLDFRSTGYATYNGTTVFGSSSRATKENIVDLDKSQKEEVIELLKNIPIKQYDYKKQYGKPFNYGFIIEDIENTKLKDLLHITQAENNKDIKMYSTEDLTRLELIAIQELIEHIQNIENYLEVNYG